MILYYVLVVSCLSYVSRLVLSLFAPHCCRTVRPLACRCPLLSPFINVALYELTNVGRRDACGVAWPHSPSLHAPGSWTRKYINLDSIIFP